MHVPFFFSSLSEMFLSLAQKILYARMQKSGRIFLIFLREYFRRRRHAVCMCVCVRCSFSCLIFPHRAWIFSFRLLFHAGRHNHLKGEKRTNTKKEASLLLFFCTFHLGALFSLGETSKLPVCCHHSRGGCSI